MYIFKTMLLIIVINILACNSYCKFKIDSKPLLKIDTSFLGIWKSSEDTDKFNFILVQDFSDVFTSGTQIVNEDYDIKNNYYYYITYMAQHGQGPELQQFPACLSRINNEIFLNITYHYIPRIERRLQGLHFLEEMDECYEFVDSEKDISGFIFVKLANVNLKFGVLNAVLIKDSTLKDLKNSDNLRNKINCLSALGEWFFRGYYVVERHWSCYHCLLNHPIE